MIYEIQMLIVQQIQFRSSHGDFVLSFDLNIIAGVIM